MKIKCCICTNTVCGQFYKRVLDYTLVKCPSCHLIYLEDVISGDGDFITRAKKDLAGSKNKEKVEYWSFPKLYEKHKVLFEYFFNERLNRIKIFKKDGKAIFDIGCGFGFWLKFCKDNGLEVFGIDESEEVIKWVRNNYNLPIQMSSFKNYQFTRKYDAITMCDVLEHLVDPNLALEKVKTGLAEGGILYLQVPNVLGFKLPLNHGFGLPFHLWQFNKETLRKLLEKNRFRILKYWTGVMGIIGVYESGGPSILGRLTWFFARRFGLGNRLMVVAQPINH